MSLAELLLVLIVAVFVLKPSDLKTALRGFKNFTRYLGKLKDEVFSSIDDEQENPEQINNYMKKILAISGKYEGEYDLPSIKAYYHKLLIENHKQQQK
jgi:Sec-independent protein translocase protein TatA